jgi:AcrR family transcriptional regulator
VGRAPRGTVPSMADSARPAPGDRPRVGRPPRISRQMIAEAAHEVGLDGLTLRAVADHLGVSIAALYHHVSGKDDLMRLAAEYSATTVPIPRDTGQHWAAWLSEWADYNRDVFLAQPGLLAQYLEGAISAETIAGSLDTILGVLVRQGFTVVEADAAYQLVTSCALGTAVTTIREREAAAAGQSIPATYRRVLADSAPDELPHLRSLAAALAGESRESFRWRVATVLAGIAVRRGEDWRPVTELLDPSDATPAPG